MQLTKREKFFSNGEPRCKKLKLEDAYTSPRQVSRSSARSADPELSPPFFLAGTEHAHSSLLQLQLDPPDTPWSETEDTFTSLRSKEKRLEEPVVVQERVK
jgi:hypothetical protein